MTTHRSSSGWTCPDSGRRCSSYGRGRPDGSRWATSRTSRTTCPQVQFPQAVKVVLESLMDDTGLHVPMGDLPEEIVENNQLIDSEIAGSAETMELVAALEDAFDTAHDRAAPVPTADEIAAEFEQFLAEREQDQNP